MIVLLMAKLGNNEYHLGSTISDHFFGDEDDSPKILLGVLMNGKEPTKSKSVGPKPEDGGLHLRDPTQGSLLNLLRASSPAAPPGAPTTPGPARPSWPWADGHLPSTHRRHRDRPNFRSGLRQEIGDATVLGGCCGWFQMQLYS